MVIVGLVGLACEGISVLYVLSSLYKQLMQRVLYLDDDTGWLPEVMEIDVAVVSETRVRGGRGFVKDVLLPEPWSLSG